MFQLGMYILLNLNNIDRNHFIFISHAQQSCVCVVYWFHSSAVRPSIQYAMSALWLVTYFHKCYGSVYASSTLVVLVRWNQSLSWIAWLAQWPRATCHHQFCLVWKGCISLSTCWGSLSECHLSEDYNFCNWKFYAYFYASWPVEREDFISRASLLSYVLHSGMDTNLDAPTWEVCNGTPFAYV